MDVHTFINLWWLAVVWKWYVLFEVIPNESLDFKDIVRCKENGCMYTIMSDADGDRHCRIAHAEDRKKNVSHVCRFKVLGVMCGAVFEKKWDLTKHKNAEGHVKRMNRKNM